MKRIRNFAFGSHLSLDRYMAMIGGRPLSRERALLPNYKLTSSALVRFPSAHADLAGSGGGPRLIMSNGSSVYGVIYEITSEQWQRLDQYEREWAYLPIEICVQTEREKSLNALAHNLVEHGDFCRPSDMFLKYMTQGLRELGYSDQIVEEVRQSILVPM